MRRYLDDARLHRHRDADADPRRRRRARATTWCRAALHPGKFFALPQSPQMFKQLLMVAGFDRYYQIARCFRDEDLRADRQPEFTQLDIETSFLDQDEILEMMEGLIRHLFKEVLDVELPNPFPRMTYAEAMRRYGSDKPDLRVPLELTDVTDLVQDGDFKVFAGPAADPDGRVAALRVPQGGKLSRKEIDDYTAFVARYGAKGLAYIKVNEVAKGRDGLQSPIVKFLSDAAVAGILERTAARDGDLIFFGADTRQGGERCLGALRLKIGQDLKLVRAGLAAAVGGRLPDVRVRRRSQALGRHASPVHERPANLDYAALAAQSRRGDRQGLRHGAERLGNRRRLGAYPHAGSAVGGVRAAGHLAGGGAAQVRLPARRAQVRRAAARRHRVRPRPDRHADGRRREHSRRDRVPEDADRRGSVDGCADGGERGAAPGAAHSPAHPSQGRVGSSCSDFGARNPC